MLRLSVEIFSAVIKSGKVYGGTCFAANAKGATMDAHRTSHARSCIEQNRLVSQAIERIAAGNVLIFEADGSLFHKKIRFTLSREGMLIDQAGALSSNKLLFIR